MPSAISSPGFPSDTNQLVDSCIARVRAAANLDDDVVLPPLPVVTPRRAVVTFSKSQTASALAATVAFDVDISDLSPLTPRKARSRTRWPLFVCAFIAGIAAGAAFIASPAGQRTGVRTHVTAAAHATMGMIVSAR